ncbi:MAG: hypothetical protein AB8F95_02115 [Bacteroidia bacterium]
MFQKLFAPTLLLFLLPIFAFAETADSTHFNGTVTYTVEMKGPKADYLLLNKPPDKMQMHVFNGDYIINLTGGEIPKTFMYINKHDREFSVDPMNKVAFKFNPHEDLNRETHKKEPVAVKLKGKTGVVLGDTCDVYAIKKGESFLYFFVNDKYRVDTTLYKGKVQAKPNFLVKGLGGRIPLKIVRKQEGLMVTTTCTGIKRRDFDKSQFRIPKDFTIRNRDYRP